LRLLRITIAVSSD